MSPTLSRIRRRMLPALAFTLGAAWAAAQAPLAPGSTVPELFAGELDDVGPQYLLLAGQRPWALDVWTDLEMTGTSNATLVETDPANSTITSAQGGVTWRTTGRPWAGGRLAWEAGVKMQVYRYGYFADDDHKINLIEIDRNDFDLTGVHLRADWRRDRWLVVAAVRGASLYSGSSHRVFYDELAAEFQTYRQHPLGAHRTLAVGLEGATRLTRTDSFGLLPEGWNDRAELGVLAVVDQELGPRWRLQPAVRVLWSRYLDSSRDRTDWHASARATLSYALAPRAELRLSGGYDCRESSEALIADFRKWDLALGASAHWRF